MFNNEEDYAYSRLSGTYVWIRSDHTERGFFLNVRGVRGNGRGGLTLHGNKLTNPGQNIDVPITRMEFAGPKLGYINYPQGLIYLSKTATPGGYRQGIRANSLVQGGLRLTNRTGVSDGWFSNNARAIELAENGVYPSFAMTMELVEESGNGVAFSRCFAISHRYEVLYKEMVVGIVSPRGGVRLNNEMNFLSEELLASCGDIIYE